MSERRLLQGKINTSDSETTAQSSEAQMRQALEHMGGQRLSLGSGSLGNPSRNGGSLSSPRHRYVRDGEVPVVHAALGRAVARPDAGLQQDKALIETMRQDLDRERAAHEAAERSLHEARAALVTLQTRLAHVEMDLQAAKEATQEALQQAAEQAAAAQAAASAEAAAMAEAATMAQIAKAAQAASAAIMAEASPAPVRRRPRIGKVGKPEREPQPVKWWVKA